MSVNIYLNEKVRQINGFTRTPYKDGSGYSLKLGEMSLSADKGRLYLSINPIDEIPEVLLGHVTDVTILEWVKGGGRRESGIYSHGTAEAELTVHDVGTKHEMANVQIKAKRYDDARALLRMIRAGELRPVKSFDGAQSGKSRQQLESEVIKLDQDLDAARNRISILEKQLADAKADIRTLQNRNATLEGDCSTRTQQIKDAQHLAATLDPQNSKRWQWPLVSKKWVASELNLALNGHRPRELN